MQLPDKTPVIALANQKGGVGKTTTAINLAASLTVLKRNILLIDMDPQANATSGLGIEKMEHQSIYDVLLGDGAIEDKILDTSYQRLDLIPAEVDLAGVEVEIARSENYLHRFKDAIAPLRKGKRYHYILLDCPPSLGILTMNALAAADAVTIPMQCEYYAMEGLSVITGVIERLKHGGANQNLELEGIVMTMYDSRTNLSRQVVNEVRSHFGNTVYRTVIPRSIRLSEAPSYGKPIIDYDARSSGALAYKALAAEFDKRQTRNRK